MYKIIFYEDQKGNTPVLEYIESLAVRDDKESNIKFGKVMDYIDKLRIDGTRIGSNYAKHLEGKIYNQIQRLEMFGTRNGKPIIKHIEGEIWELRPVPDRILFAAWIENSFVLLHQFRKETQKTPRSEIEKAQRELEDFKSRNT